MMNKKNLPHIVTVVSFVVFIVLGVASASSSDVKNASSIDDVTGLDNKLKWLNSNAVSGGDYVLELYTNEVIFTGGFSNNTNPSFKDRSDITITLRGVGATQSITTTTPSNLFTVGSGVTLILDNNITLQGVQSGIAANSALVYIRSGGILVMNDGSTITGHSCDGNGGGVYVADGGTFLMKGGTIIGNFSFYTVASAQAFAAGDALARKQLSPLTSNTPTSSDTSSTPSVPTRRGGGVYVSMQGTFTKTGGTIAGFTSEQKTSNAVIDPTGKPIHDNGHAVYAALGTRMGILVNETGSKRKEKTASSDVNLHISNGTFSGDWDY